MTLSTPGNAILGAISACLHDHERYCAVPASAAADARRRTISTVTAAATSVSSIQPRGSGSLRLSTVGELTDRFGSAGAVPVTGDFDGDGRSDYGIFDSSSGLWNLRLSAGGEVDGSASGPRDGAGER